jgi:acyl-lipid omega-6 desaturase (Delta-12 desaturase)
MTNERLRQVMAQFHGRSNWPGFIAGACDCAVYLACFWLLATHPSWRWGLPLALVQMLFIARLFVLGHDACHGSLFRSRAANRFFGRILFLPSLTPFAPWETGHNSTHHGYSNLKGHDYVWTPYSPEEWRHLPAGRRRLERIYRSPWGLGAYYGLEIWWRRLFFPDPRGMRSYRTGYFWDSVLVASFLALQGVAVWRIAPSEWRFAALGFTLALPLVLWNYLMAFAIHCHHTHPEVRWFESRADWTFYEAQVRSTIQTTIPGGAGWLFHHIFEHTAHHVDTGIPFYRLRGAQRKLEELCGADIVRMEPFSVRTFLSHLRACQLYDYRNHRWLRFSEACSQAQSGD